MIYIKATDSLLPFLEAVFVISLVTLALQLSLFDHHLHWTMEVPCQRLLDFPKKNSHEGITKTDRAMDEKMIHILCHIPHEHILLKTVAKTFKSIYI